LERWLPAPPFVVGLGARLRLRHRRDIVVDR